ncbi:TIGR03503 family protein [Aliiglaciecola litoralis]|uniref:TIGR03503 family protein n=1 Tax=Aliiglaciecola litoralis TaxID=582857 RepID=A0ABP3X0P8_9ALTE
MCCSTYAVAQATSDSKSEQTSQPLVELGDEFHNSIKLLSNRFRIDYKVEEITMVFFREYGSAPIVLVQPDGSKLFQSEADGENLFWYDASTYDLINIKNPTPGPWQAVGQILPNSRIMVISDIELHADPLPEVLFSGEILKQTARLTNGGEPIDDPEIRDVVSLEIKFVSTNNPNFNNFGAEAQTIAVFEDNGRGMDERPLDGIFTGQFNLSVANGQWSPVFVVSTPMLSREQVDPPLMLYPNPIKINMIEDGGGDGYHKLVVDAEREFVDMESLLIDGKVRFPNGDVQNFSLTQQIPDAREYLIVNYEAGVYRIKLTAYGNTKSGRDFILDVPEYTYLVEEPVVAEPAVEVSDTSTNSGDSASLVEAGSQLASDGMDDTEQDEMSPGLFWGLIIGINSFILIVGGGLLWFFLRPAKASLPQEELTEATESIGLLEKIRNLRSKKSKQEPSPQVDKPADEAGIIDLSLPKDN